MPSPDNIENQDNPEFWKKSGNDYFSKGLYEDAIKCYFKAIELDHDYSDAWNNLGYTYLKLGKNEEADRCIRKVKEIKQTSGKFSSNKPKLKKIFKIAIFSAIIIMGIIFILPMITTDRNQNLLENESLSTMTSESAVSPDFEITSTSPPQFNENSLYNNSKIELVGTGLIQTPTIPVTTIPPTQEPVYQDEYFLKESVSFHDLNSQNWIKMRDYYNSGDYQSAMHYANAIHQSGKDCDETVKDVVGRCVDVRSFWRGIVSPKLYRAQQEYLSGNSNLQKAAFFIYGAAWGISLDPEKNLSDKQIDTAKQYIANARSHFNSANRLLSGYSNWEYYSVNWIYI